MEAILNSAYNYRSLPQTESTSFLQIREFTVFSQKKKHKKGFIKEEYKELQVGLEALKSVFPAHLMSPAHVARGGGGRHSKPIL